MDLSEQLIQYISRAIPKEPFPKEILMKALDEAGCPYDRTSAKDEKPQRWNTDIVGEQILISPWFFGISWVRGGVQTQQSLKEAFTIRIDLP